MLWGGLGIWRFFDLNNVKGIEVYWNNGNHEGNIGLKDNHVTDANQEYESHASFVDRVNNTSKLYESYYI